MQEYREIKRMLTGNLAAGAVLGAILAGFFAYNAARPELNASFFQSAAQAGHAETDAMIAFVVGVALVCLCFFAFGLFLPLGREAIKRAKDRMLSGWIVSLFVLLVIQIAYLGIVLTCGSFVGLAYLLYNLVRLRRVKRATATEGR
ncbi:hypothetical protein [Arabiibacter massiliensis]|uniref:hypothetical protein n=1 Tax=Arabiibacter massiliensis TaxID=1870985 RepID=UPI0009BB4A92|nr:hypothetical protein [Arabiibacter massiliensis]